MQGGGQLKQIILTSCSSIITTCLESWINLVFHKKTAEWQKNILTHIQKFKTFLAQGFSAIIEWPPETSTTRQTGDH